MPDTPPDEASRWIDRGDTELYDCPWLRLVTTDVELPDGTRIDHHVVRLPNPAAGTIMVREGAVLLLWRHRFITDTWGYELPAGAVDQGESPDDAARREAVEESGWRPRTVERICSFHPANGVLDQVFHIYVSHDAEHIGPPSDVNEAARIEWVPVEQVRHHILSGGISDGLSFGGLNFAFTAGVL
ncbi:MAG: NUDIX hydrolase [Ilumatobacter fluminis]|uniref:NUDIX hydrolase n=1 Tax=Ilumatobacter fluminis TaxID=467091 RepID=UPI0032EEE207